jgi:ribosomal subunit interface protein
MQVALWRKTMDVIITRKKKPVTPAIKAWVSMKLSRIIDTCNEITSIKVIIDDELRKKKSEKYSVSFIIGAVKTTLIATGSHANLYSAIKLAVNKLIARIRTYSTTLGIYIRCSRQIFRENQQQNQMWNLSMRA